MVTRVTDHKHVVIKAEEEKRNHEEKVKNHKK